MRGFGFLGRDACSCSRCFWSRSRWRPGLSWFRLMDCDRPRRVCWRSAGSARAARSAEDVARRARRAHRARGSAQGRHGQAGQARADQDRADARADREERDAPKRETADSAVRRRIARRRDLPPLSLLDEPQPAGKGYSEETLEALSRQVEFKLKDFRIDAQVVSAHPGPVITRFEIAAGAGHQGQPDFESRQGHRARPVGGQRARGRRDSGQVGDRSGNSRTPIARSSISRKSCSSDKYDSAEIAAGARAGQGYRRPAGGRRSRQDAASAGRRHHGLGQVGRASTRWC